MITEKIYLTDRFADLDALNAALQIYDSSTLAYVASCPRAYQYRVKEGLGKPGGSRYLVSGTALHAALDTFYITGDREEALARLTEVWGEQDDIPCSAYESHLTIANLQIILKNFFDWAQLDAGTQFTALKIKEEDLDFSTVLGAKYRVTDDGYVLLGESSLLMEMQVDGQTFPFAGKPDLIIANTSGNRYVLDFKTTSSYLSEWAMNRHRVSNQLRCYMLMINQLTGLTLHGGMILGIYTGDKAAKEGFGGKRFAPFRFSWTMDMAREAMRNQLHWSQLAELMEAEGYFPQAANDACRSCTFAQICESDPEYRDGVVYTDYEKVGWRDFFEL